MKIFDSHLHIIDPAFPLIPNQGYLPESFGAEDYLKKASAWGVRGGAVVSGSFQAFDQSYLFAALKKLGSSFVGVTQLPFSASDEEIFRLNDVGVRAIRFNLKRGGSEGLEHLEAFAKRVYSLTSWHVELYVDSRDLETLFPILTRLPSVSIDHLGLSKGGGSTLLKLVEKGCKVKATGFGRLDFPVLPALKAIIAVNPDALLFGTDLPSTRAPRPFLEEDMRLILDNFDPALCDKIFYSNAVKFYKPNG